MAISYFDEIFFSSFIRQEDDEVMDICHRHIITIIDTIIIWIFFGVILPTFFYYNNTFGSRDLIDFMYFRIYLFITYVYLLYKIFDWYNDVWIITEKGIIDLDWQLMKTNTVYIEYSDVKGIAVIQDSYWDGFLNKGQIEIHTQGEGSVFALPHAKNPGHIVGYIQGILEEREKNKKEKEKTLNERIFSTIKGMVKDHLDKESKPKIVEPEKSEEELLDEKIIGKALKREGTIDLRKHPG